MAFRFNKCCVWFGRFWSKPWSYSPATKSVQNDNSLLDKYWINSGFLLLLQWHVGNLWKAPTIVDQRPRLIPAAQNQGHPLIKHHSRPALDPDITSLCWWCRHWIVGPAHCALHDAAVPTTGTGHRHHQTEPRSNYERLSLRQADCQTWGAALMLCNCCWSSLVRRVAVFARSNIDLLGCDLTQY